MKYYVMSDIHGRLDLLVKRMEEIKAEIKEEDTLVFLGDYIDRGKDGFSVLSFIKEIQENMKENCHVLMGNHDKMFLDFLDFGDTLSLHNDWSIKTIKSFIRGTEMEKHIAFTDYLFDKRTRASVKNDIRSYILREHKELIDWMRNFDYYYETDKTIFVHAGLDLDLEDWKQTSKENMIWNRPNLQMKNNTNKRIVVGHTMTRNLISHDGIYIHEENGCPPIYFIDGAAVVSNNLNLLILEE